MAADAATAEPAPRGRADLVTDCAMPLSGCALCAITGLENMGWRTMDPVSQAMIYCIANYAGDPAVEARCRAAVATIDAHIDERVPAVQKAPDQSLLAAQLRAGLPMEAVRANVRLAISGGQNEPRDAIAGAVWALLTHPDQLAMALEGRVAWGQVFDEYVRWMSPIGMSPAGWQKATRSTGWRWNRRSVCSSCSARPTATRCISIRRTASTSRATRPGTSHWRRAAFLRRRRRQPGADRGRGAADAVRGPAGPAPDRRAAHRRLGVPRASRPAGRLGGVTATPGLP